VTRAPLTIMAVLAALLMGVWWLTDGRAEEPSKPAPVAPVPVIAERVEAIRGQRFETLPKPVSVSPSQARREALVDLDRSYPAARRRADEEILKLLGLIDPSVDLREVSGSLFSEGVAGYYDPRTKRLRTVRGADTGGRVVTEMILAHELTHALEDQRFGLGLDDSGTDDAALARLALTEGTASDLMFSYARRHFSQEETLGGVLASSFAPTGSVPGFLQAQLTFPYVGGQRFVEALRDRAGGRWTLVDLAVRTRPPTTTEQVLHPGKWVRFEPALPVRIRAREALGAGWRRAADGVWGEWGTREMLATAGGGGSADAASGWGGDRFELWQRGTAGGCKAPCRSDSALIVRWAWDTPADGREFAAKLRQWVRDGLGATRRAGGTSGIGGGHVAVGARDGAVTLAMAPTGPLARRLAAAGPAAAG
jgi:hypothetical protein